MENIIKHNYVVSKAERNRQYGHASFVLWFTGLSGSGKSTIANALEYKLFKMGLKTYSLDGDNIRLGINKGLTFTSEDRHENLRRIAEVGIEVRQMGHQLFTNEEMIKLLILSEM